MSEFEYTDNGKPVLLNNYMTPGFEINAIQTVNPSNTPSMASVKRALKQMDVKVDATFSPIYDTTGLNGMTLEGFTSEPASIHEPTTFTREFVTLKKGAVTQFYIGSLSIIGLYILFRFLK